jgi:pimeloyl-ACP methyl ester carboxylesterase
MISLRSSLALATAALILAYTVVRGQSANGRVDSAFQKFWSANSPDEAERLTDAIVKSGVTFDEALRRLKAGRTYSAQKTGIVQLSNKTKDGVEHFYALNVPANYDPARRYHVRFQLHGGVGGRESNQPRGTGESPLQGAEQIYVVPYAWNAAPWWSDDQVLNLAAITDWLKRTYNIDENHVVVAGVSDGGTGAYYVGMRDTTPYASFLPLNGFIMVIATDSIDDGDVFPNNLRNKPMFVVNGGKDPLYPISSVEPFVKHLMSAVNIEYHPRPEAGHNTAWWPEIKDVFEKFVAEHPRDPYPDRLTWETANLEHNRAHWLVIDQLGPQPGDTPFPSDLNLMLDPDSVSGTTPRAVPLFGRPRRTGRVDLIRKRNTIEASSRGVTALTLLLSPDRFDFTQPVKVVANGHTVFEGRVERDIKTLMKWAARDNDRTMLYGAELKIKLPR